MALRTIRIMGDEVLTKVCREVKKVTPRISELIDDMLETMYDACGVGLAAPQVGGTAQNRSNRCRRGSDRYDQPGDP